MKITLTLGAALALFALALIAITPPAFAEPSPSARTRPTFIRSSSVITSTFYFPLVTNFLPNACAPIPNQTYGTVAISGTSTDRPAAIHADLNLGFRGYTLTNQSRTLVDLAGETDPNAPQLDGLFSPPRLPSFPSAWQVGDWDWTCNCRVGWVIDPAVTLLGMGTSVAEIIDTPPFTAGIGSRPQALLDGYAAMVLYATTQRITLKYTREDNVVNGYTIHLENICVEPNLLALYESWNSQGRSRLPAVNSRQPIGRARSGEILTAIRDTGTFMDPRSRKDWWQGY